MEGVSEMVSVDFDCLWYVFINLLVNVLKYLLEGSMIMFYV